MALERIKFGLDYDAVPFKLVNPLHIDKLEQISGFMDRPGRSRGAIPINPDLLWKLVTGDRYMR